jgi:hypothetical protein
MSRETTIKIIFILSLAFLFYCVVEKLFVGNSFQKEVQSMTTVTVKDKFINKGKISIDSNVNAVKADFVVINSGENDLYIDKVSVSCKCTSATQLNVPIHAGDTALIHVEYNKPRPGYFFTDVIVHGNFKGSPLILSFEGHLIDS